MFQQKMLTEPEDAAFAKQSGEIVKFDTAPMPAGGFKTIQENLIYPDQARKEGLEGKVILNVLITENGDVEDINILKSLSKGCDDAAIAAVKLTKWQPAKSKDTPVKVWVGIPVVFRLNENKPSDPHGATAIPTDKDGKLTVLGQPSDKRFAAWDEPPKPVDGFAAVQKNLRYPELARKAGIEGRVILNVLIGSDGVVKETKVLQDLAEGNNGCAEAASDAVKATQWQPAQKMENSLIPGLPFRLFLNCSKE